MMMDPNINRLINVERFRQ